MLKPLSGFFFPLLVFFRCFFFKGKRVVVRILVAQGKRERGLYRWTENSKLKNGNNFVFCGSFLFMYIINSSSTLSSLIMPTSVPRSLFHHFCFFK